MAGLALHCTVRGIDGEAGTTVVQLARSPIDPHLAIAAMARVHCGTLVDRAARPILHLVA